MQRADSRLRLQCLSRMFSTCTAHILSNRELSAVTGQLAPRDFASRRALQSLAAALVLVCGALWLSPGVAAEIDYVYNSKGQLSEAHYADGTIVTYLYDGNGNRTSVTSTGGPDIKAPTVPPAVSVTVASSSRIDVSWSASTDAGGSGLVGYKVERCQGGSCTNFSQIATPAASPYQNTGLSASTTYRYRVRAYDNAGNHSDYSAIVSATTTADTTPPSTPGTLSATVASSSRIDLGWGAASDNGGSGLAGYKIERCQGASCTNYSQIHQQSGRTYQDTSVSASTTYRYRVRAYDNAGNNSTSYTNVVTATTTADTTAPTKPTSLAAAGSATRVDLTWTASTDAGGSGLAGYKIQRCTGAGCTNYNQIATSPTNSHADTTAVSNTTYRYRVRAYDNAGNNSSYSNVVTVTTPQDTSKPTAPATLSATAASSTQVNLSWAASTDSGGNLAGYKIERCQNAGCSSFSPVATVLVSDPNGRNYQDTGRSPTTTYVYRVYAYDSAGNNSDGYSPTASATTPADTAPPSVPAISVSPASSTQLNVSWTASTDTGGAGLAGYKLERCQGAGCSSFAQIATLGSNTTSYSDSALAASTTYIYRIRAYDNANPANHSGYSANASGTTSLDTTAPTAPGNLSGSAASGSQINLSWAGSTDTGGSGLAGYRIERCSGSCQSFSLVGSTSGTAFPNTGLTDATTYTYRVYAYDTANNSSDYSNTVSIPTPDVTPPTPPTNYIIDSITANAARVTWSGASDNVGITGYRYRVVPGGVWQEVGSVNFAQPTGLTCYATYTVEVQARDAAVGYGNSSVSPAFTTLDGCPPGPPGTPSFSNINYTTANVSWAAATDNVGVTAYQYSLNGGSSWTDIGSSPGDDLGSDRTDAVYGGDTGARCRWQLGSGECCQHIPDAVADADAALERGRFCLRSRFSLSQLHAHVVGRDLPARNRWRSATGGLLAEPHARHKQVRGEGDWSGCRLSGGIQYLDELPSNMASAGAIQRRRHEELFLHHHDPQYGHRRHCREQYHADRL